MAEKAVLVTGGNSGIGLALCQQLLADHGCRVFMTSRDVGRGAQALDSLGLADDVKARCTVVPMDVSSEESVQAAAEIVKEASSAPLYAVVNNAGTGLAHKGITSQQLEETNFYGPKRVVDAFMPLLDPEAGRIVNVGSGAAGRYVQNLGETDEARMLIAGEVGWDELDAYVKEKLASDKVNVQAHYGLSKAALAAWTQSLPRTYPKITSSCCSPGFIATNIVAGYGATKPPSEGTVAIRKLLFERLEGNGWYYASDGLRGPYHYMRNPGQPVYDGKMPF